MRGMARPQTKKIEEAPKGYVGAETLLCELWRDKKSRPSLRWLRGMQARRLLPYRKIGRRVYFDPEEVRRAIDSQFTVESIG